MSFAEVVKETVGSVVEAIQENPITAAAIAGGAVVVGGGVWFWRKRKIKKNAVDVKATIAHLEQVAAAGNPALAAAHAAAAEKATA